MGSRCGSGPWLWLASALRNGASPLNLPLPLPSVARVALLGNLLWSPGLNRDYCAAYCEGHG